MYVDTKELPRPIQAALLALKYHAKNIEVTPTETTSASACSGDGYKAFMAIVDLNGERTPSHEILWGSWGGANMFNPQNRVDLDTAERPIPHGKAIIKGHIGGTSRQTYAYIEVSPSQLAPLLPPPQTLPPRETMIVAIVAHTKGGAYRKEALQRNAVTQAEIDALVSAGFLTKNKAQHIAVTTKGRNASENVRIPY